MKLSNTWEYNLFNIENYNDRNPRVEYYSYIRENEHKFDGDIVEAGVFQGRSLMATALLLKEIGSKKKVYGFDTFAGFPPVYHSNDDFSKFEELRNLGLISQEHYDDTTKMKDIKKILKDHTNSPSAISSSTDFSATSKDMIIRKCQTLGLDNVVLVEGKFEESMKKSFNIKSVFAANFDCDLYSSYISAFNFVWPKLNPGGFIYLDEYYSLKFPGAIIACQEFLADKNSEIHSVRSSEYDNFLRAHVLKGSD